MKSLFGYLLGVVGVYEVIYCLLMMEGGFIVGFVNIDEFDLEVVDLLIFCEICENVKFDIVMSNSFGFGGINVILVFKCWQG